MSVWGEMWIWQKSENDPVEKSQIDRLLFCENAIMWALPNCSSCGARQFQFCIVFRWSSFCFPLISADQSCQQVVITSLINVIVTFHSGQLVVFHEEKHQGILLPNVLHICLKYIVIEYLQNKLKTLRSSILTQTGRLHSAPPAQHWGICGTGVPSIKPKLAPVALSARAPC